MTNRLLTLTFLYIAFLTSCNNETDEAYNLINTEEGSGIKAEFVLEATQQDDVARVLNFTVGNNGALTVDTPQEVPVLLILRNTQGNETVFNTRWQRKPAGNGYVLSLGTSSPVKLELPKGSTLTSNDLYVSAILGANKEMYRNKQLFLTAQSKQFDVLGQILTERHIGNTFTMHVPYILPWTKVIPINRGTFIGFSFETKKANTFLMQGTILRVQLRNKQPNPIILKQLEIKSNVLGHDGSFNLSELPKLGSTPPFTFTGSQTTTLNFATSSQVAASQESGFFYFWIMPQIQSHSRSTKITALIEGSQGPTSVVLATTTAQISSRSNFRVPGVIEQVKPVEDPNNPLSWIAEYNLSNTPGVFATTHSNIFSTNAVENDGTRASGYYTFDETQKTLMPSGYHIPSYLEVSAIFPPHLIIDTNGFIQQYTYPIMHTPPYRDREFPSPLFRILSQVARFYPDRDKEVDVHPQELIMAKGKLITPSARYYTPDKGMSNNPMDKDPKSNIIHARRFIDTPYESLWRYEFIKNPWSDGKILKVSCRLTKGITDEELKNLSDSFWATDNGKDVIRYFPALGTITAEDATFQFALEDDASMVNRTDVPRMNGYFGSYWTATRKPEFASFLHEFERLFEGREVIGGVFGFSPSNVAASISLYRHKYNIRPMKDNP